MIRRAAAGSTAVITGASSGIGRALARQLAAARVNLVISARRGARLAQLAAELGGLAQQTVYVAGDLTDAAVRAEIVATAVARFGGLDLLINNAGVGAIGPFAAASPERLRQIMEVNFFAPVELIRAALPVLAAGSQPAIVNIGSVLGHRAVPNKSEYCASKFALHGFSDALRAELAATGIHVLLVSPSTTQSEFFDRVLEDASVGAPRSGRGMPAERVARQTLRALRRGRQEIILSAGGKLLVWLDRVSPPLMNRLLARFG